MDHTSALEPARVILHVLIILFAAKIFGEASERLGQPPVLGELLAGIVLGASVLGLVAPNDVLHVLAEFGAIVLLFEVGLESDLEEFLRVGASAAAVAVIGVAGPFVVGYFAAQWFGLDCLTSMFIGATLTATSVGITARTLSDIGRLRTPEAKVILGAAVIDDVIGLIILAVVAGLVKTHAVSAWGIAKISLLAVGFLIGALAIGVPVAPRVLNIVRRLRTRGTLTVSAIIFAFGMAYLAHELKLATIVGAFAAGLVLAKTEDQAHIQERIKPVADIFVPIFFVMLGVSVDVMAFDPSKSGSAGILMLTGVLIVIAIAMKLCAGLGVLRRGVKRLAVGIGMIPRGEVGLIFASFGLANGVIKQDLYSAIVAVVAVTTFVTPPLLKLALRSGKKVVEVP